jgi:phospholipid-transporting ATPase
MSSVISEDDEDKNRIINVNRENVKKRRCCKYFCIRNYQTYIDNKIVTSKYNFLSFLPLNLLLQFSKMANLYFLILTIMECYPPISDAGGIPVLLMPLSFVVGISMIKDIYEDYMRHKSDNEENKRKALVAKKQKFEHVHWQAIKVGQIVKVHENEYFPCDLLVINSSLPKGICYVETKNLDGETNMKHKQADKEIL